LQLRQVRGSDHDEGRFGSQGSLQERKVHREEDGKIQYLLRAEEQLLGLISTRERCQSYSMKSAAHSIARSAT
jgi:hypothetical protein